MSYEAHQYPDVRLAASRLLWVMTRELKTLSYGVGNFKGFSPYFEVMDSLAETAAGDWDNIEEMAKELMRLPTIKLKGTTEYWDLFCKIVVDAANEAGAEVGQLEAGRPAIDLLSTNFNIDHEEWLRLGEYHGWASPR